MDDGITDVPRPGWWVARWRTAAVTAELGLDAVRAAVHVVGVRLSVRLWLLEVADVAGRHQVVRVVPTLETDDDVRHLVEPGDELVRRIARVVTGLGIRPEVRRGVRRALDRCLIDWGRPCEYERGRCRRCWHPDPDYVPRERRTATVRKPDDDDAR